MTTCPRCGKENIDVHTCTPESTTPVGGTVEGDKLLVHVTCKCGKHFNIPYQQGFTIDLRGDFFVKCACGGSYNLFDEGKKALERQGATLPIAGKKFTDDEIRDFCDDLSDGLSDQQIIKIFCKMKGMYQD